MLFQARSLRFFGFALLVSLSGCSGWFAGDTTATPEVRLVKIQLLRAKLLQQHFLLSFQVDNPSDHHLRVRGLDYRIRLQGLLLAEGEFDDSFSVRAHDSKVFYVPVRTNLWQNLRGIVALLHKPHEPIRYRLDGELKTGFMFGPTVQLARNGEIMPGDFIPERTP